MIVLSCDGCGKRLCGEPSAVCPDPMPQFVLTEGWGHRHTMGAHTELLHFCSRECLKTWARERA